MVEWQDFSITVENIYKAEVKKWKNNKNKNMMKNSNFY